MRLTCLISKSRYVQKEVKLGNIFEESFSLKVLSIGNFILISPIKALLFYIVSVSRAPFTESSACKIFQEIMYATKIFVATLLYIYKTMENSQVLIADI